MIAFLRGNWSVANLDHLFDTISRVHAYTDMDLEPSSGVNSAEVWTEGNGADLISEGASALAALPPR